MSEQERLLVERWHAEKQAYDLWGRFICDRLTSRLRQAIGDDGFVNFLKMPLAPRLKTDASFVEKALHRKKYADPFGDTEDKVGIRLVVLLETDLRLIETVLCTETESWTAVLSRDHELEMADKPYEFGYQSLHYVVRSAPGLVFDGDQLNAGMPCEVQIRTLLQHAHSELTHDTIFKPSVITTPSMKRAAAKSMALIEATGDYFALLADQLKAALANDSALTDFLSTKYQDFVGQAPGPATSPLNKLLIDRYKDTVQGGFQEIEAWLSAHTFVSGLVREKAVQRFSYQLPAILLVYFSVGTAPRQTRINSPLNDRDLESVYIDLGKPFAD